MNRQETFHTYGLKPKLLFCSNISALCSCYHLNHRAPILTILSQRPSQHLWLGCILSFPPPCAITVSLLTNAFSSSRSLLRSGSHKYLASSQSCLAIDDSNSHVRHRLPHILLCSQQLCTTSLHARSSTITPPPCLYATLACHPLILVEQNPNTLYFISSYLYFQSCSEPLLISCCPPVLSFRIFMQQWPSPHPEKSYQIGPNRHTNTLSKTSYVGCITA